MNQTAPLSRSRVRSRELIRDVETSLADMAQKTMARQAQMLSSARPGETVDSPEKLAADLARAFADWLADAWGGQQLYIPMDLARRNARIYEAFDGTNHAELADRFNMSANTVYSILRDERARRSPGLFDQLD